jgi:hypothetical protein
MVKVAISVNMPVTYYPYTLDEYTVSRPWWDNFVKKYNTDRGTNSHLFNTALAANYAELYRNYYTGCMLMFDSQEDMTAFILRWS